MSEHYLISPCCEAAIDLNGLAGDQVVCPMCSKRYAIREDIDFAEFSSASMEYYKWSSDDTYIIKYYFHNMTLDEIEGVAERIKSIPLKERRPYVLLPIFKAVHDCIKKRLQQYLVFDRIPNLSQEQKARIEEDLLFPGNNLFKLMDYLLEAYPEVDSRILGFRNNDMLKMLMWIRNKEEHIAVVTWPIRSFVHIDKTKLPSDEEGHIAELTVPLAIELLNFGIDLLKMIYDLDPERVDMWHYQRLEQYRIHCTV
jgi:hypothetical protein